LLAIALLCSGAKSQGCSTELESNGTAGSWEFGPIPAAQPAQPMTCEWLERDNCWKQLVARAASCLPEERTAVFSEARDGCSFSDGARVEFDGEVAVPSPGTVHYPIIQHRVVDARGDSCFATRWLGIAHVALDVAGEVAVLQATSLTTFQVTCPDGSTYASHLPGTCPEIGAKWLARDTPGYDVVCDGDSGVCQARFNGADQADSQAFACEP
jgi:hypothetical protein